MKKEVCTFNVFPSPFPSPFPLPCTPSMEEYGNYYHILYLITGEQEVFSHLLSIFPYNTAIKSQVPNFFQFHTFI